MISDCLFNVLQFSDIQTTVKCLRITKETNSYINTQYFWKQLCERDFNDEYNEIELLDHVIKLDSNIHISNSQFHGITDEISQSTGVEFSVVAENFKEQLVQCSHIIAHNIDFDVNIIKSESIFY